MPYTPLAKSVLHQTHTQRQLQLALLQLNQTREQLLQAYEEIEDLTAELVRTRMLADSLRMMN